MANRTVGFSRFKVWTVFIILFICGAFVGVGIANWGHSLKLKTDAEQQKGAEELTSCQAIERVLLEQVNHNDNSCSDNKYDLETYKKLVAYGCPENREKFLQAAQNLNAVIAVTCTEYVPADKTCLQIEGHLNSKLGSYYVEMSADEHIERAKIYAVMAERGCPENSAKYTELAKKELEVARGISDDKFNEGETIEVVETYKRLKMQQDAEEIFNKAKKLTNPAIDFIMQVEKIINE